MQYRVENSKRLVALVDLEAEVDINSAWETIGENIKMSAKERQCFHELKKHNSWFSEGRSKFLKERKQTRLQWLQIQAQ
jgi:hypothetical protein